MRQKISTSVVTGLIATGLNFTPVLADNHTVTTESGAVQGRSENGVNSWFNVPYGHSERYEAPTTPVAWQGTRDATVPGQGDIQLDSSKSTVNAPVTKGFENDLTLDIYRSKTTHKKLPVLVYIHGGNNQSGLSTELSGASFVKRHNAIFVSINYRLGGLGFNPLPALKTGTKAENSGNFALLDMHQSFKWLHDNISQFGGDPDNITAAGFSAGGRDVMAMLISPIFKNDFKQAIVFSGGMTTSRPEDAQQIFSKKLAPLVVEDGIKPDVVTAKKWLLSSDAEVAAYLNNLSAERITAQLGGDAGIRMAGFPHLYRDGYVLPKQGFNTQKYLNVPVLMTTGSQEFSLFGLSDPYFKSAFSDGKLTGKSTIAKEFRFVNKYGGELYQYFNVQRSAEKMTKHRTAPTYALHLDFGADKNAIDQTSQMKLLRSFHGVFVPLLDTDNTNYKTYVGKTYQSTGAKKLANTFQNSIYRFMTTSHPSQAKSDWPPFTGEAKNIRVLSATDKRVEQKLIHANQSGPSIIKQMHQDKTLTTEQKDKLVHDVLNGRWFSAPLTKW